MNVLQIKKTWFIPHTQIEITVNWNENLMDNNNNNNNVNVIEHYK